MAVKVNADACSGCGACAEQCPCEAIAIKDGLAVIDQDTCSDCGSCIDACPTSAISEG